MRQRCSPTSMTAVQWQQNEVLRYDRYVAEQRLTGGLRQSGPPDAVRQTSLHLEAAHRVRFDGVAAILYRDGRRLPGTAQRP